METSTAATESRLDVANSYEKESGTKVAIMDVPTVGLPAAPFKLARVEVPAGGMTDPDTHEVREIWMIARGEGRLVLAGEETRVRAGDVLFFDSHQTHTLHNEGDTPIEFFTVWWRPRGNTPD